MQPCIAYIVCVCGWGGGGGGLQYCVHCQIYIWRSFSLRVQVCTLAHALLNTLQDVAELLRTCTTCLLCACVVWLARPSHYMLRVLAYMQQLFCVHTCAWWKWRDIPNMTIPHSLQGEGVCCYMQFEVRVLLMERLCFNSYNMQ